MSAANQGLPLLNQPECIRQLVLGPTDQLEQEVAEA